MRAVAGEAVLCPVISRTVRSPASECACYEVTQVVLEQGSLNNKNHQKMDGDGWLYGSK